MFNFAIYNKTPPKELGLDSVSDLPVEDKLTLPNLQATIAFAMHCTMEW